MSFSHPFRFKNFQFIFRVHSILWPNYVKCKLQSRQPAQPTDHPVKPTHAPKNPTFHPLWRCLDFVLDSLDCNFWALRASGCQGISAQLRMLVSQLKSRLNKYIIRPFASNAWAAPINRQHLPTNARIEIRNRNRNPSVFVHLCIWGT